MYICAGEASGDALAAHLMGALQGAGPAEFRGLAGPAMRALGVDVVADSSQATAAGLVEVVGAVPRIARLMSLLERDAVRFDPDVVVTVDSPGMMLRLGARFRRRGLPVVHVVAPQVWAWRPERARRIGRSVDALLCLFAHEPALFEDHCSSTFIGHPLLAALPVAKPAPQVTIALCPGSRPSELAQHWPALREVGRRLRRSLPGCRLVVPRAPGVDVSKLSGLDVLFVDGIDGLVGAHAAVACSGTLTLQLAVMGVPQVVIYRVHPATWKVARRLVRTPWIALPNNLAGRGIVPEVLQDLDPAVIEAQLLDLLGVIGQRQVRALAPVVADLCDPQGTYRAVNAILGAARRQG